MPKRYGLWSYTAGAAAARTGDAMSGPALLLAGLAVTGSAVSASSLLAGATVAAAVGGPVVGVLLDRSPRPGRLLAAALVGYVLALALVLAVLGRVPLALTVLIAVFGGLLGPALAGGWTSQLPRVVPPGALPRANALDAMTFNAAGLVGPALAGTTAQLAGARTGVVVSVVLVCLAVPVALALPPRGTRGREHPGGDRPEREHPPGGGPERADPGGLGRTGSGGAGGPERAHRMPPVGGTPSVRAELAAGFRALLRSRPLARATAATVITCTADGIFVACAPLLGERTLGGAGQGTILLSGVAVVALAANALLARRPGLLRPDTVIGWSAVLLMAGTVLASAAATGRPALLIAAVIVLGIGEGPQLTALFAIRHRESPARLRGQIFTTGASLKLTGFAIGAGAAGPLATWSLPGALLTAAGVQSLAALVCVRRSRGRDGGEAGSFRDDGEAAPSRTEAGPSRTEAGPSRTEKTAGRTPWTRRWRRGRAGADPDGAGPFRGGGAHGIS
ncbi:MFS transporter [Streptomyces sp. NPDC055078]